MLEFRCCVLLALACLAGIAHGQTTSYVDDNNCPAPGSGTQGDPFCSIQDAIDAAAPSGDDIEVQPGTNNETINFNGKAVTVRSTDPLDPAVVAATIIDAQGAGTAVTCDSGEGPGTVLDGLTITGGDSSSGGGAMRNSGSSPTVNNCTLSGNSADEPFPGAGGGACSGRVLRGGVARGTGDPT